MGYYEALARKDQGIESRDIAKKAAKKGLWGSVGRTLGSLAVMGLTGGTLNPVTLGLLTGGASFLGGAAGAAASGTGDIGKGRAFFKEEGEKLQRELGAFGSENITSALKSGLTAGIGQKLKLGKMGREAEVAGKSAEEVAAIKKGVGFGESFKESMLGRASQKLSRASYPTMEKATLSPMAKKMASDPSATLKEIEGIRNRSLQVGEGLVPSVGDTTGVGTGTFPTGGSDDLYEMTMRDIYRPKVDLPLEDTFSTGSAIGNKDELGNLIGYDNYPLANQTSIRPTSKELFKDEMMGSAFDEGSWAKGKKTLRSIDFQQSTDLIERLGLPGSSRYTGLRRSIEGK